MKTRSRTKKTPEPKPGPPLSLTGETLRVYDYLIDRLGDPWDGDRLAVALAAVALEHAAAEGSIEALAEARLWLSELGLTPSSRLQESSRKRRGLER